jgi:hypothetical protein
LLAPALAVAEAAAEPSNIDWFGDLRIRAERTTDIPARSDDIKRERAALRAGGRYNTDNGWEFAGAIKLAVGSDDNDDSRRNNDNELSNGAAWISSTPLQLRRISQSRRQEQHAAGSVTRVGPRSASVGVSIDMPPACAISTPFI